MSEKVENLGRWQDVSAVLLRWLFFLGFAIGIFIIRDQLQDSATPPLLEEPDYGDLLLTVGVGVVATIIALTSSYIRQSRWATAYLFILGDWLAAGLWIFISDGHPVFTVAVIAGMAIVGVPRRETVSNSFNLLILVAIALGMMIYFGDTSQGSETIDFNQVFTIYGVSIVSVIFVALGMGLWRYVQYRFVDSHQVKLTKMAAEREARMEDMEERAKAISEMTTTLSSTLSFHKVLEAALSIGDISLRVDRNQRVMSMVMLFRADNSLYIAYSRGLKGGYERHTFRADDGALHDALSDGIPIISKNPWKDVILGEISGFKTMRSLLCVPLRAQYENFGILVFASTMPKAFNPDHIEILNVLGLQATVALQNAVLYDNLLREKDRLIEMEEDARKELVRDLHDVPTQTISAVAMRIRIVMRMMETQPPQKLMGELEEMEQMALRATEEIRHVLFTTRPLALEAQGLIAALNQLAEKMQKTHKQNVVIDVHEDFEDYLDETRQGPLFYLVEEATNNARKYAQASRITVKGRKRDDTLYLRIEDNGQGFDTSLITDNYHERGSFGMVNMQERADSLNGTLEIDSSPGAGTRITVAIPIYYDRLGQQDIPHYTPSLDTKLAVKAKKTIAKFHG